MTKTFIMAKIYDGYSDKEPNNNKVIVSVKASILKERFLELFMLTAHIGKTCDILGLVPRTVYHWKNKDKQFNTDLEMARMVTAGLLEDEATRRAVYGTEKPIYQNGKRVGSITEYSDSLLTTLLKANAPSKFKDKFSGELTGADGQPLYGETKIVHVHSNIPLASSEDEIRVDDRVTMQIPEHIDSKVSETNNDDLLNSI